MPVYVYECPEHGRFDRVLSLREHVTEVACECGRTAPQRLTPTAVLGDYEGYRCPVTDRWIEGRKAHEENLKRTGCRVSEPGEKEEFLRRKARDEATFEASIEESVGRAVAAMPAEKQAALAKELSTGSETTIIRG